MKARHIHFRHARLFAQSSSMTSGVIWKQLLFFFFPIVFGSFFQQLYNTVDAMVVGKVLGKQALAAVGGTTASLVNLLIGFFIGLSSGATVIISQFYGAENQSAVSRAVHTAMAMSLLFGLILTAAGFLLTPWMLRVIATPEDVMPYAVSYLRVIFLGMVPLLVYNVGAGILRAIGDSRRPLLFLIASCMTNIVLDILFVVFFQMGVAGAALATIASQFVSAFLVIRCLVRAKGATHLDLRKIRLHKSLLASITRIGLPTGLQSVMYSLSNVIIQKAINGFDTDALAGWTAYGKIDGLFWMMVNAFGIAVTTFVGQNFGARKLDRCKKGVRTSFLLCYSATLIMGTVLLLLGEVFYTLFTDDPAVIASGLHILRLLVPWYLTYLPIEIFSGALHGAGDTLIPTLITLFGVCLVRILWIVFAVPRWFMLDTVLYSYAITWVLTSVLFFIYYLRGNWLRRCLERSGMVLDGQKP